MTDRPENWSDAIIKAWACLARIERLAFTAQPGPGSRTGWAGQGQGQATVEIVDEQRIRLIETGQFELAHKPGPNGSGRPARPLSFRNTYLWACYDNTLHLSHERFGQGNSVFLFSLSALGPSQFASQGAHLCGADRYSAQLGLNDDGFTLDWHIAGPAKDERLFYQYSTASGVEP